MENNQNVPNVSVVYRQLVQLSHTNPRLNAYSADYSNQNSNQIRRNIDYKNIDFVNKMGLDDRQKRHQQLMNKLKSSLQQNRQIFGISQSPIQRGYGNFQNKQYENTNYSHSNSYNYRNNNTNTYQNQNRVPQQGSNKWMPPKIRYRHIQDLQQPSKINQSTISNENRNDKISLPPQLQKQLKLKQQFYQSQLSNSKSKLIKGKQQENINNQVQQEGNYDQQDEVNSQQINYNKFSALSIKHNNAKYGENLSSYYQLCKRPIKNNKVLQKSETNSNKNDKSEKFIRKQVPKVQGINLQKAMKILSLDD